MTSTILKGLTPQRSHQMDLRELVTQLWPEATPKEVELAIEGGQVKVNGRPKRQPKHKPEPGSQVLVSAPLSQAQYGMPEAAELARGEGWIIVDKPIGMPGVLAQDDPMDPILFMADMAGLERDHIRPVWPMPTLAGGPWMLSTEESAQALTQEVLSSQGLAWVVITPRVGIPRGSFKGASGATYTYNGVRMTETLSELFVYVAPGTPPADDPVGDMLDALLMEGYAVLGDRARGGFVVSGGMRVRLAILNHDPLGLAYSWSTPKRWWPDDPIAPTLPKEEPDARSAQAPQAQQVAQHAGQVRAFKVSPKTLEVLAEGHQWALDDKQTDRRDRITPGTLVHLHDVRGSKGPWGLVEGPGEIAARVWSWHPEDTYALGKTAMARFDQAMIHREDLLRDSAHTNLYRLVHAEADGLPGFYLDRLGPLLRATITSHTTRAFKSAIYANLMDEYPEMAILEVAHLEDVRARKKGRAEALPQATIVHCPHEYLTNQQRVIALEDDLRYWCEPWEGIDSGFFADQRENRRTLVERAAPGQRWLNLFGHTGAFSVALAARGAHVVNVDVSKRYLQWTADNFELNQLPADLNEGHAQDARLYMESCTQTFDGIIVDPPTAAKTQGGFWSVRKDYAELLVACFERLAPGGVMLVCRNDRKRQGSLAQMVRQAAKDAAFALDTIEQAGPSSDYPILEGFPESRRFEGLMVYGK